MPTEEKTKRRIICKSPPIPINRLPPDSLAAKLIAAATICQRVFDGKSLAEGFFAALPADDRPAVQDMVYSTLRAFGRGDFILGRLLQRPLDNPLIHALLLVSLYLLENPSQNAFTVVNQAVEATKHLDKRLPGLVNGVLRRALREKAALQLAFSKDAIAYSEHPAWWLAKLQKNWAENWQQIIHAGNARPPMALRVNLRRISRTAYLEKLSAAGLKTLEAPPDILPNDALICLETPCPVARLPGFEEGLVSVQDPGAQKAALLLDLKAGDRVLDACAAPGGKAAHLLELTDIELTALDHDPIRSTRITDTLKRLDLRASVQTQNCIDFAKSYRGELFDAILADVPCSGSGVVRRHPDAKWLRQPGDIARFATAQAEILAALWPLITPNGKLLYVTCSVFAAENTNQIATFLLQHDNAEVRVQITLLPNDWHDGFFYCLLQKTSKQNHTTG